MTDLPRLASRVFETPLLMQAGKLETILSAIGPRLLAGEFNSAERPQPNPAAGSGALGDASGVAYIAGGGIAVLPIVGTLVHRSSWLDAVCGMTSYQSIAESVVGALKTPGVRGLLIEFDSPGGEVAGCFDLARLIRAEAAAAGIPVWGVANELAASAGYALMTAASRLWVPATGVVGSIGVVGAHIDQTRADEMAGLKWTLIHAGEHKVEMSSHVALSNGALARAQADIDRVYGMFVDLVAAHRNLSADTVKGTGAAVYRGTLAVEAGLADDVGTIRDALNAFAEFLDQPGAFRSATYPQGKTTMRSKAEIDRTEARQGWDASLKEMRRRKGFTAAPLTGARPSHAVNNEVRDGWDASLEEFARRRGIVSPPGTGARPSQMSGSEGRQPRDQRPDLEPGISPASRDAVPQSRRLSAGWLASVNKVRAARGFPLIDE